MNLVYKSVKNKSCENIRVGLVVRDFDIVDGMVVFYLGASIIIPRGYYAEILPHENFSKYPLLLGNSVIIFGDTFGEEFTVSCSLSEKKSRFNLNILKGKVLFQFVVKKRKNFLGGDLTNVFGNEISRLNLKIQKLEAKNG